MDFKKNEVFQVRIEDMSDEGEGIGKTGGFTWFIKDAVIGDLVEAKVMKTKKSYGFARLMRVLEASPYRREPRCPEARRCGGCQFQVMDYEEQLRFKENKVCNNLRRIGGIRNLQMVDEGGKPREGEELSGVGESSGAGESGEVMVYPIIGMEDPWRYRNKSQFPFGRNKEGKIITGFYASRTHVIIEHQDCLLGVQENQPILDCIREYMEEYGIQPYDEESHTGLVRHVLIRKAFRTGQIMVCLVINGKVKGLKAADVLVERLVGLFDSGKCGDSQECGDSQKCEDAQKYDDSGKREDSHKYGNSRVVTVACSINRERTNVIMGKEIVNLYGPGNIVDYIEDIGYRISPLSFYQVNSKQTEQLYRTALDFAQLTGKETVWDLYCGIGTISLFLARQAGKVYGVEIVPEAIEDARANAAFNHIDNVEFFVGKAEEVLPELYETRQIYADVIVVDPPRKGCDKLCLDTMIKMKPERIVYVSCDSATLARDLKYLGEGGYEVKKVRTVDMFGWGGHVETVARLVKKR